MKRQILFLLSIVMCLLLMFGCSAKSGSDDNSSGKADSIEDMIYENGETISATPDETGARPAQIPGFTPDREMLRLSLPYGINGTPLQVIAVGRYSGYYVEDGTDDSVTDVSAVVVQNIGQKCIKNATVILAGKDAKEYAFAITTLPSGKAALILESHRSEWQKEEEIAHISAVSEELDELELHSDKLSISFKDGKFRVKNLTDADYRAVYIRYKNYTAGNVYMGGVTYSASIDNVMAHGEYECESIHFFKGYSEVLMLQVIE
ncbi:MAG: hypothetical protein IKB72_02335 [Ruminococcus sp.]|nr:hypothetical protein [Ruminococcus sp.]